MKVVFLVFLMFPLFSTYAAYEWDIEKKEKPKAAKTRIKTNKKRRKGNLPDYALLVNPSEVSINRMTKPDSKSVTYTLTTVKGGETFRVSSRKMIKAVEDSRLPISVTILGGELNNAKLVGKTVLDTSTKSILINFDKMFTEDGREFNVSASGELNGSFLFTPTKYFSNKSHFNLKYLGLSVLGIAGRAASNRPVFGWGRVNTNDRIKNDLGQAMTDEMIAERNDLRRNQKNKKDMAVIAGLRFFKVTFLEQPIQK